MHFGVLKKILSPLNGDLKMGTVSLPLQWCKGLMSSLRCQHKPDFQQLHVGIFLTPLMRAAVTDTLKLSDEVQQVRGNADIIEELIGVCQYLPPLAGV